jgi:hypothetical protein
MTKASLIKTYSERKLELVIKKTYSTLFMAAIAASASESWAKRTKPKPRLRPVSRSLTTTCKVNSCQCILVTQAQFSYSFFDLTIFLKLSAEGRVICVPCKAAAKQLAMVS